MRMKKVLISSLAVFMFLGATMSAKATFNRSYTAPKGTPVIDGVVDSVWETAEWTAVDNSWDGQTEPIATLQMKILWDDDHLYFLAQVYDERVKDSHDIVEIYLDQKNNKSWAYEVDDTHTRFYVNGGVVTTPIAERGKNAQLDALSASRLTGQGEHTIEGALKWPLGTPEVGDEMGLEFMYQDGFGCQDFFVEALRWNADTANGDQAPYQGTSAFGTLVLADATTTENDDTNNDTSTDTTTDNQKPTNNPTTTKPAETTKPTTTAKPTTTTNPAATTKPATTTKPAETTKPTTSTNEDTSKKEDSTQVKEEEQQKVEDKTEQKEVLYVEKEAKKQPSTTLIIILVALAVVLGGAIAVALTILTMNKKKNQG